VEQRVGDERAEEEYVHRTDGVPAEQAAAIAVEISDDRREENDRPPEAKGTTIKSGKIRRAYNKLMTPIKNKGDKQ
jgi:hypothetical protein